VFPEEGTDLSELLERVKRIPGNNTAKIEDYVFGVKIIIASFVCEDSAARDFEEEVKKVPGVSEVQVEEVGLIT
jgi:translation elongation factor EF-1beta